MSSYNSRDGHFSDRLSDFTKGEPNRGQVAENEQVGPTDERHLLPYYVQPTSQDNDLAEISFLLKCNGWWALLAWIDL